MLYPVAAANLSDAAASALVSKAMTEVLNIISADNTNLTDSCSKCAAALSVGQMVARLAPSYLPDALVALCQTTGFSSNSTCQTTYEATSFGAVWTQVLAKADVAGLDGRYICSSLSTSFCSAPPVIPVKASFPKERPADVSVPVRSGTRAKVFHLSDMHLGKHCSWFKHGGVLLTRRPKTPDTKLERRETVRQALAADLVPLCRTEACQRLSLRLPCMDGMSVTRHTIWLWRLYNPSGP